MDSHQIHRCSVGQIDYATVRIGFSFAAKCQHTSLINSKTAKPTMHAAPFLPSGADIIFSGAHKQHDFLLEGALPTILTF